MDHLEAFHAAAERAADAVRAMPRGTRWFIHCDTDADGLSGAAVTALALTRMGHRFQLRASRDKTAAAYDAALRQEADGHIFVDKGSSHADALAATGPDAGTIIVIDHHNLSTEPDGIHIVNPRTAGLDGSNDASSGTTAVAFAQALIGDDAYRWAGIGLVGAIGDWQHMGGWDGWNRRLVDLGIEHGALEHRARPALVGMDIADALASGRAPDLPGLRGDRKAATAFVGALHVEASDVEELPEDAATALVTGMALQGLAHEAPLKVLGRLTTPMLYDVRLGGLRNAFRIADACGREGQAGTGIAFLMGDSSARSDAEACFRRYRDAISSNLTRLRLEGPRPHETFQEFAVDHPAYTGMVAGLGMTHAVSDRTRPMVVHAPRDDGLVQVSGRGLDDQVQRGLDLGKAMLVAGRRIGREGGGHPVAAGIVIAPDERRAFLQALDEVLTQQGFLEDA